jgi:2-methylisocitrate lyase-like PEP mutase family enzyme
MQFDVRQVTSGIAARGAHLTRQMTVNREVDVVASKQVLSDRAASLLALHQPGNPVVLPTVWDAWSAKVAADAGFAALTVGSHPVADSIGRADGGGMTFDELLTRAVQITDAVDVPVSVDIESGYGEAPTRLIDGLLDAGAVGLNIEDTVHNEGKRLRSASEHAELVGALRAAADAAGVHVVINARTDLFIRKDGDEADRVDRAIARLTEAAQAGADVLYPVGRHDPDTLRRLAAELPLPINAIALPDQDDPASFGPLGVGRISFGPFLQAALTGRAKEILGRWS